MGVQKYPVGIQTFEKIIKDDWVYIDKTGYIPSLVNEGVYYFLSRPRRFGKSLLLSMLHSYFEGKRELFKGLAVDSMDVEWKSRPVIHIDLNSSNYIRDDGLDLILGRILQRYEEEYGLKVSGVDYAGRFIALIQRIYDRTGERVVILVDEYDKPLLNIEDNPELFRHNQATLKAFFGVLKSMDRLIQFAMLTGVARFNKVSIFSDLNNLHDISLSDKYADICGITEREMLENMSPGIETLAAKIGKSYDATVNLLRYYYDGYLFTEHGSRLYNPFSLLNALDDSRLAYYWYETGNPTFLVKRVKSSGIVLPDLNKAKSTELGLMSVGMDDRNPIPLLFQTGYLTIKNVQGRRYELQFPNHEVETCFVEQLQPLFLPQMDEVSGEFSIWEFQDEIVEGKPEAFMKRLQAMVKSVPYEQHNEKFYQNIVYILFTLLGTDSRMEEHTNRGRPDLVVRTVKYIYVFEFKYEGNADEAISQIRDKDYAGRHAADSRTVFLIGASFSKELRGLADWKIEKL